MTRCASIGLAVVLALLALVGRQYWPGPADAPSVPDRQVAAAPVPGLNPLSGRVA